MQPLLCKMSILKRFHIKEAILQKKIIMVFLQKRLVYWVCASTELGISGDKHESRDQNAMSQKYRDSPQVFTLE